MEVLSGIRDLMANPSEVWPTLHERGHHVLDLIRSHPWATLGVATGTALLWRYVRTPRNLPPGPTNFPLVGAVSCFSKLEEKMLAWRPKYGDVVFFYMLGHPVIILNSETIIREAFVKRTEEFSHRQNDGALEAIGLTDEIFMAPYNETWKKNKKFAVSTLKTYGFGTAKGEEIIHGQLEHLEHYLMKSNGSPVDVEEQLKLLSSAIISAIVLGDSASFDDPNVAVLVQLVADWYQTLSDVVPLFAAWGQALNPFMARLLCWRGLKAFNTGHENLSEFVIRRIETHKKGLSERDPKDVADAYLKERGTDHSTIKNMAKTILGFLPDAIETASVLDLWLLFYVAFYPEVQQKLHEEVDSICGKSRRPTLADRPMMPYAQAMIHETLRVIDTFSLSLPRELHQNVNLNGYNLPKGSTVMANFYAVHFDPKVFPNPKVYDPSRFIDDDGTFNTSLSSKVMTFGVGSRKCIGEPSYKIHAFLFLTRTLQHFDLEFDPSTPRPTLEQENTFILKKPDSFKLCFKPR